MKNYHRRRNYERHTNDQPSPTIKHGEFVKIDTRTKPHRIVVGDHFADFIYRQLESGRYFSVNEIIKAALRVLEDEENSKVRPLNKPRKRKHVEKTDAIKFLQEIEKILKGEI